MPEMDKRHFPRYRARTKVEVALLQPGTPTPVQTGTPINLSRSGAYLHADTVQPGPYTVWFDLDSAAAGKLRIERDCRVLKDRSSNGKGVALEFLDVLSESDLGLLAALPTSVPPYDLAQSDYNVVSGELGIIRSCRAQIFLTTLVAIGAWVMGAIGLGLTNHLQYPPWIALGTSFPYLVLSISILCLIEKAISTNMRKGFLAALEDYLRNNLGPPNYAGWSHLSVNVDACKQRAAQGLCREAKAGQVDARCFVGSPHQWRSYFRFSVGTIFGKFGTLAAFIIGPLYVGSSGLLYWYCSTHLFGDHYTLHLALGAGIAGIFAFLLYYIYSITWGGNCVEAWYFRWKHALVQCCTIDGVRLGAHRVHPV